MAILFSGSPYTQNFDTLASSGTGNTWSNDGNTTPTIPGWSLFRQPAPGTAITTYNAGTGSSSTGNFYSYGSSQSDRALGGLGSSGTYFGSPGNNNVAGWIAFSAQNTSGVNIDSVTVEFDGEQWRNGGNTTAQSMVFEYGFGNTFSTVSTWNAPGGNFDWSSPVASNSSAAVDGNADVGGGGLVANRGGTLNNLGWSNGSTLWFRWIENNDAGNDHGLAIDDFSLTNNTVINPAAVPEPADFIGTLVATCAAVFIKRRLAAAKK